MPVHDASTGFVHSPRDSESKLFNSFNVHLLKVCTQRVLRLEICVHVFFTSHFLMYIRLQMQYIYSATAYKTTNQIGRHHSPFYLVLPRSSGHIHLRLAPFYLYLSRSLDSK